MYPENLPLRDDLREAHAASWKAIGTPGAFFPGDHRVQIVTAARESIECKLCSDRKSAISPTAVTGEHDNTTGLHPVMVDAIHRIRTDPNRLTKFWFDQIMEAGISPQAYVEMVSVVNTSVIIDTLHRSLGLALPMLPTALSGEPSGEYNTAAVDNGAWVPVTAADQDVADTGLPSVPNIVRAMGLVPSAVMLFFGTFRPHYALKNIQLSISQAQAEFVASRVSALNECFY